MSEEETKDMSEKYDTRPTIETVLERITTLGLGIDARLDKMEERIDKMEERLGVRLDRIESEVKLTHSELYSMRADFTAITLGV